MRILLFIFSLSIVLTSCTLGGKQTGVPSENTGSGKSYTTSLENTSSKIKNTKEFGECMSTSVNMCVNQVGNQLARAQKSPAFCDEMEAGPARDGCKYGVIMSVTSETKDITACDALTSEYKSECRVGVLLQIALSSDDLRKCNAIATESLTNSGNAMNLSERADQCRADIIMKNQNSKEADCNILEKNASKEMCKSILKNRSLIRNPLEASPKPTNIK